MKQLVRVLRSCSHNFAWTAQIDNSEPQESYVDYTLSRRAPKIRMGRALLRRSFWGKNSRHNLVAIGFLALAYLHEAGTCVLQKICTSTCLSPILIPSRITQMQRRSCLRRIRTMEQCPNAFQAARRTFLHLAVDFAII